MQFLRRALNPWGEDVPIGVSWDLIWVAVILGAVFVVVHALMVPRKMDGAEIDEKEARGLPEKLQRHAVGARGFHCSMSAAMFALLITAFFPLIGIRFPWVTIHWIAGVLLILTLVYHIYHVFARQDFWAMWIGRKAGAQVRDYLSRYEAALAVLRRDAEASRAFVRLVAAQPAVSSQLIDNLNASIHLRALLTDVFVLGELVGV